MATEQRPFGFLFAEPTRNGINRPKAVRGAGIKMVNMGELFAFPRLRNAAMDRVPFDDSEARFLLKDGDLLFARQSLVLEGAGKCSLFMTDHEPVTFESHITRVRLDPSKADPTYYFYYLQSPHGRSAVRSIVEQGAGASGIRGSDLETLEVQWRPMDEQRAIAHILGTLDDKIELNRRMNETLEEMARALFKSWFVDIGHTPVKVGHLVEKGILEVGDGYRAKNSELREPGLPFMRAGNLSGGFDTRGAETLCQESVVRAENKRSRPGDVAFTSKGTVGRFARVTNLTPPFVYSPQICYWRSLDASHLHPAILYCWMQSDDLKRQLEAVAGQTDMAPYVSLRDQRAMEIPAFPVSQEALGKRIDLLLWRQAQASEENRCLENLRDTLLPKLISGELRVKDAQRIIEAAS
jgi:type I restriction enzyme S subunit